MKFDLLSDSDSGFPAQRHVSCTRRAAFSRDYLLLNRCRCHQVTSANG